MDVLRFGAADVRALRAKTVWGFCLLVVSALAGCFWRQAQAFKPVSSSSVAQLAHTTEQIRGLSFKWQVKLSSEPATAAAGAEELSGQAVDQLSRAYHRIGLLPGSADLAKALPEFQRLQRAATYAPELNAIILSREATQMGQALAGPTGREARSVPVIMALTHALQEQHFHWEERIKRLSSEDRKLAFRAVANGDALRVAMNFLKTDQSATPWTDYVQAVGRLTAELESAAASLPPMLRQKLVFPYAEGSQFVWWAYTAKGNGGINALYSDPPVSSAQILHPEKYYLRRELPLQIIPFGLFRQLKRQPIVEQTLGEFLLRVLLASNNTRAEAALIASGWTGDYLSSYRDGGNLITAWFTAWKNGRDAQKFYRAFKTTLERRHGLRFEASPPFVGSIADIGAARSAVLQARGSLVLLLDSVPSEQASAIAEAAWNDVEINGESPVVQFEIASERTSQRASMRK